MLAQVPGADLNHGIDKADWQRSFAASAGRKEPPVSKVAFLWRVTFIRVLSMDTLNSQQESLSRQRRSLTNDKPGVFAPSRLPHKHHEKASPGGEPARISPNDSN